MLLQSWKLLQIRFQSFQDPWMPNSTPILVQLVYETHKQDSRQTESLQKADGVRRLVHRFFGRLNRVASLAVRLHLLVFLLITHQRSVAVRVRLDGTESGFWLQVQTWNINAKMNGNKWAKLFHFLIVPASSGPYQLLLERLGGQRTPPPHQQTAPQKSLGRHTANSDITGLMLVSKSRKEADHDIARADECTHSGFLRLKTLITC